MEQKPKNNLIQEELYFKELNPTKLPDHIEPQIDGFLFTTDFKSDEAILRKYAFGYVISSLVILGFFHQLGAGFFNFNIGSALNFLGPVFKQLINGLCFNSLAVASVLVFSFDKKDVDLLVSQKDKIVYTLTIFMWLFLCMFGSEFTWSGAFLWLIGAYFGCHAGLNFGVKFVTEQLPE